MCSYGFGEVREQTTRALLDDDVHEDSPDVLRIQWKNSSPIPKKIGTLLIVEGDACSDFAEICLLDGEPVDAIPECGVSLYESGERSLTVCLWRRPDIATAAEVTECLRARIERAERVVCLKSCPLSLFRTTDRTESEFVVRALKTSRFEDDALAPVLERPNMMTGLSAGALTLCEFIDRPAVLYVIYSRPSVGGLDSTGAEPMKRLLQNLNIKLLKPFKPRTKVASNLYM